MAIYSTPSAQRLIRKAASCLLNQIPAKKSAQDQADCPDTLDEMAQRSVIVRLHIVNCRQSGLVFPTCPSEIGTFSRSIEWPGAFYRIIVKTLVKTNAQSRNSECQKFFTQTRKKPVASCVPVTRGLVDVREHLGKKRQLGEFAVVNFNLCLEIFSQSECGYLDSIFHKISLNYHTINIDRAPESPREKPIDELLLRKNVQLKIQLGYRLKS